MKKMMYLRVNNFREEASNSLIGASLTNGGAWQIWLEANKLHKKVDMRKTMTTSSL